MNTHNNNVNNSKEANGDQSPPPLLLSEMEYGHYFALSDLLDEHSAGGDYRRLAALFGFSREDIERLAMVWRWGLRPTEQLLRILNQRMPDLRVYDVEIKCIEMCRMDVVTYIREKVYNTSRQRKEFGIHSRSLSWLGTNPEKVIELTKKKKLF